VVEYSLHSGGEHWVFSFSPDVPVAPVDPGGELAGDVPQGLVLIVRGPGGAWSCSGDYRGWEYSPNIRAPEAPPPTTTTTGGATEETPATTLPPTTG